MDKHFEVFCLPQNKLSLLLGGLNLSEYETQTHNIWIRTFFERGKE
jgi:hypothetical protein